METQTLNDICDYRKGKVPVSDLTVKNYISTENLLPNKGGIVDAAGLPSADFTQAFCADDVLVSNIRPYFRKIWHARENGGCSNDVLVFKAKPGVDPTFLYYVLADDKFFDYSTASSKGTKMPRGDKSAIMQYEVPKVGISVQRKIGKMLRNIDDKIAVNEAINRNLYNQIQMAYTAWFVDYRPFGGVMPSDWVETPLSDIAQFVSGYSYKGEELQESNVAMATIKNFDRNGGFKLDGYKEIKPSKKLKENQHVELFDTLVAHTDLTQGAEVIGNAEIVLSKSCYVDIVFSMDLVKVLPNHQQVSKFLIAALLHDLRFKSHCLGYVNGTTVLHLNKKALPDYALMLPKDLSVLRPFDEMVTAFYKQISNNMEESIRLADLRDALLPKLMSGELDVSELDV